MKPHDDGLTRVFHKNGRNYKRVKVFKSEEEADAYCEQLKQESGSVRYEPIVERMRWAMSNTGILHNMGFTRYRVYVPIMEK
jgi:viroplasmin and RNaseH domain-containing protein